MSNQSTAAFNPAELTEDWRRLWNGDLTLANRIIAKNFVAHAAPITGSGDDTIEGREALKQWIAGIHAILADLNFALDLGPIVDRMFMVIRWRAQGRYVGGFPGASDSAVGRTVTFTGTDTLKIESGMIAEYWANADSLLFVQQLGVHEVPGTVR